MKIHSSLRAGCCGAIAASSFVWWLSNTSALIPGSDDTLSRSAVRYGHGTTSDRRFQSESKARIPLTVDSSPLSVMEAPDPNLSPERFCLELSANDPRTALRHAIDRGLDGVAPAILENITAQWASRDFHAAYQWVMMQEPGEFRNGLMSRVVQTGSKVDPVTAGRIVAEDMSPGPQQDEAAISVLHQWALRDLESATAWAGLFPSDGLQFRAMEEIAVIRCSLESSSNPPRQTSASGTTKSGHELR